MKRACLSILVFAFILFSFTSSENPLEKLIAGFKKYLGQLPQEKVYLHFDRPYYTSGETIWIKAYLTAGALHEPSDLSRTIYVELINGQGELVKQLRLLSVNGSAAGDITLSDSLSTGNYLVRAYTHWMRNGDENYFFHRLIKIWNNETQTPAITTTENLPVISFFPEGGEMVNGFVCKVGFKAIGADGLGREIKGKIIDESGAIICEFKSNFLGMGAFTFTPQKGKSYKAVIENYGSDVQLPPIKESGIVMSVRNVLSSEELIVRIQTTDYTNFKTIYIIGQTRGIVCYAARTDLSANFLIAKIPKAKFPGGIAQITLADSNGIPLAERLVFVNEREQVTFKITPDKSTYSPRELVKLQIEAMDAKGKPAIADLSLSVCDDSQVLPDENHESISSYLLLSSDLRGNIESPGYYFNPANEDRAEALDYLLLTQGWRRFAFKKALEEQWPKPEYQVEQGLTIKGKMVDKFNDKPIADGKVTYLSFGPSLDVKEVRTNSIGDFEMHDIVYFDSVQAVLQGETKKGSKLIKFQINNTPDFPATQFPLLPLKGTQNAFEKAFLARSIERKNIDNKYHFDEKSVMLQEVEVRTQKDESENSRVSNYGSGTISRRVADNPAYENMLHPLQLLQGRVAGVQVSGSGQNWSVTIRGSGTINGNPTPLILLDNVPVAIETLNMIPVRDIERFDVWKGADAVIFGVQGANGVIGFFTKKGVTVRPPKEGIITFGEVGYQVERQFYAPKYDVEKPEHKRPDKRTTLFWAPHIQTDAKGQATVSFYNHDLETSATGIIEGISNTGKPITATFKYSIEKK